MYMEGPSSDSEILPNQEVPFTWEFKGFGNQTCYVDGQLVENAAEHTCLSPINVRVPNRKNHTFTVELEVRITQQKCLVTCPCAYVIVAERSLHCLWQDKAGHP